ncbi:MAG: hypothetical protein ACE5F1_12450 [Planctomycetota bacterium]
MNNEQSRSFQDLLADLRPAIRKKLAGEGTDPSQSQDVAEVLSQLLAFAWAVERALIQASGRENAIPGHMISVRGYVEQVLSGEDRRASIERLNSYFVEAIRLLLMQNLAGERDLDQYSRHLVSVFRPSRIIDDTKVGALFRLLGLSETAYWREYQRRWRSLDAQGLRQLAEEEAARTGPVVDPALGAVP